MEKTFKKITMNAVRKSVIEVLAVAQEPMTLAEIGAKIGCPVKSGTTNAMVAAGIIKVAGKKTVTVMKPKENATYSVGADAFKEIKGVKASELRRKIFDCLKAADEPLTLEEIGSRIGVKVSAGTTNPMVKGGILVASGKKEVMRSTKAVKDTYIIGDIDIVNHYIA